MLMMLATAIDATDGWLARKARVKEVLPHFDGRALDDLIDFHTYTSLPLLLLWRAGTLPGGLAAVLILPLLASAYGFSQTNAKTDDGFFLGFPSYWNIVAFYLYILAPPAWAAVALLVTCSVLTFVPDALHLCDARRSVRRDRECRRRRMVRRDRIRAAAAARIGGAAGDRLARLSDGLPRAVGGGHGSSRVPGGVHGPQRTIRLSALTPPRATPSRVMTVSA